MELDDLMLESVLHYLKIENTLDVQIAVVITKSRPLTLLELHSTDTSYSKSIWTIWSETISE